MTILVTGATGTVGSQVVNQLVTRDADVRVLTRNPDNADLPAQITTVPDARGTRRREHPNRTLNIYSLYCAQRINA